MSRFSLVNPAWTFDASIYFGCREPHFPLEYGYSKALLEGAGHEVEIVDAQLEGLTTDCVAGRVKEFQPDFAVVTTAPSYLFWRCAPPELRVPRETMRALRGAAGALVAVGPHASTTPRATLAKLGCDAVVMGECEEVLPELAGDWAAVDSLCYRRDEQIVIQGRPHASDMSALPALHWPDADIRRHSHHHHRFDSTPVKPGAEMETSRGCPYHCTFCAKDNFRNNFRRRPLAVIAEELDGLVAQGVEYVYFIDEIFLPFRDVLELIGARRIRFGIQTRLDLWTPEMIALLGAAGCVSIEAGVESITEAGRARLDKKCKISTADITDRLVFAKESVGIPFVQANLLDSLDDDPAEVEAWRGQLGAHGVWANKPVPLFPYPGSPDYTLRWGAVDDQAWERAHDWYLGRFDEFSDVQEQRPARLVQLEKPQLETHA
jgi:B12-binding domain/radical SAM domain protein of rhizo-twelve system